MVSPCAPDQMSSRRVEIHGLVVADEWDAGDMGCGEILIMLRARMRKLAPGDVLKLTARDLGAPEDMPAWCRLTGRRLVLADHPNYWIEQPRR